MQSRVYFDIETDGLADDAQIIQIGAAAVRDGKVVETFERKILFDVSRSEQTALELNGYTPEVWAAQAVEPIAAADHFAAFLNGYKCIPKVSKAGKPYKVAQLAGYNSAVFDAPRIQRFFRALNVFLPADYKVLDVFQLVLWLFPDLESQKLKAVCEHIGIPLDNAHDALADVTATALLGERLSARLCLSPVGTMHSK